MMTDLLFVYGSLLDDRNEFGRYLQSHSTFIANGYVLGRLFDAEEYPGAILTEEGYPIKGKIYQIRDLQNHLPFLDDYEGYGDEQLQPNLFIRQLTTVTNQLEKTVCWIYVYNWPLTGLTEISSGDYTAYIAQK